MSAFREQTAGFAAAREQETRHARQVAATQLVCGINLDTTLSADAAAMWRLVWRLERAIERERLRGLRRHWSYDLNRHIALKQALDRLRARLARVAVEQSLK